LQRHHGSAADLPVGFHRRAAGRPGSSWPQSVDEALCFGWIDGVRRRIDAHSYCMRLHAAPPRLVALSHEQLLIPQFMRRPAATGRRR
jgi:hypothetical protein